VMCAYCCFIRQSLSGTTVPMASINTNAQPALLLLPAARVLLAPDAPALAHRCGLSDHMVLNRSSNRRCCRVTIAQ
jgi:hypothetical protein